MGGWALTFDTTFSFTHICFLITPQLYKFLDTWHMEFFFYYYLEERKTAARKKKRSFSYRNRPTGHEAFSGHEGTGTGLEGGKHLR